MREKKKKTSQPIPFMQSHPPVHPVVIVAAWLTDIILPSPSPSTGIQQQLIPGPSHRLHQLFPVFSFTYSKWIIHQVLLYLSRAKGEVNAFEKNNRVGAVLVFLALISQLFLFFCAWPLPCYAKEGYLWLYCWQMQNDNMV